MGSSRRAFGEVWRKRRGDGSWAWFARYRVGGRRVCRMAGETRAEAEAYLAARQVEAAHARLDGRRPAPLTSLAAFEERLLRIWRARLSATTIRSRKSVLKRAVAFFGRRPMTEIRRADVEAWCAQLGVAPSSVRQSLLVLSGAFTVAIELGLCRENPCRGARIARVEQQPRPWISQERLAALYAKMPDEIRAIVVLIGETGLRRSEALGLRWKDFDDAGVTVVGKGGKTRRVPLTDFALRAIAEHRRARPGTPEARLWRIHAPQFNQAFRAGADAAGQHDVTPHTLRHAFASGLVRAGVDLPTVARLLGHTRIETTMRYAQWAPGGAEARAIEQLAAARHGQTLEHHSVIADGSTK